MSSFRFAPGLGAAVRHAGRCASAAAIALACASSAIAQSAAGFGGTAAPVTGASAPMALQPGIGAAADYPIGGGDLLSIAVYRAPDIGGLVRTGSDGSVVVPGVGLVALDGLTAAEAAAKISAEIKRNGLLLAPSVTVLVTEVRAHQIQVMGEVGRPGTIPLDTRAMTLSTVLARAGAPFGSGSGVVTVIHPDGSREKFMMADLVSGGADRPARSGEVVVVAAAATVYVSGEVGRPGAYPIEKDMTVGQALALAGGFTPGASQGKIRVTHKRADGSNQIVARSAIAARIEPGDLVTVGRRVF